MSDAPMEYEESAAEPYIRTIEDVQSIVKHAKLDKRHLTQVTQALYYPSDEIQFSDFKLIELDSHMLQQIRAGKTLEFKGGLNEKVVVCTDERTYEVKAAEISNSLLVVPGLKFAAATSTSPLKSPRNAAQAPVMDRSLNDSTDDELAPAAERTLEHRPVLGIFHEYMECREIQPRFRKMFELLQATRYAGPEHEEFIDRSLLFTRQQLLDTVQCSRAQFGDGLRLCRALEYDGRMRVLECEYEFRIVNLMVGLIAENSWPLDEIERDTTIQALDGIVPAAIVEGLFDFYTESVPDKPGKYSYDEEMVARIVARNILQPGLKFRMDEFMSSWLEALPDGMRCKEKYLRGLGIFDREGNTSCIRALAEENLTMNLQDRMRILFKTKSRWTVDEIEPYIECFTSPSLTVASLLAKYARMVREGNDRYYVAKH